MEKSRLNLNFTAGYFGKNIPLSDKKKGHRLLIIAILNCFLHSSDSANNGSRVQPNEPNIKETLMNGLNTKSNTMAWLESQVGLLDILIESVSTHTDTDTKLLECIEGHRKWLESELKVLQNPDKYRLSGYAKQIVYPLLSDATAMRV